MKIVVIGGTGLIGSKTVERLRKKGTTIALEAANPEFKTRIFGPDQVDIQGRLVGLLRRY